MKPFALSLIVLVLWLPLRAAEIVPDPFPPAHFTNLYLEKDDKGTITSVQLSGENVIYKVTAGTQVLENITVHPSGDDWFAFIKGLNAAKVYKWAPDYTYPGQGVTWIIDLGFEDRKLTSGGTNDYPKDGAEDQPQADPKAGPSVPFQVFWQAALALVGKAPPPKVSK
jgi:hypothetical protein